MEQLHQDMTRLELPSYVPESVRRYHDGIRNAYVYSYFSYDLLTLAVSQAFPCLELALRLRIGGPFEGRVKQGGEATRGMAAEAGRVAYVPADQMAEVPDPGALAVGIWLEAIQNTIFDG